MPDSYTWRENKLNYGGGIMKLIYFSHGKDGRWDEAWVEKDGTVIQIKESTPEWNELMDELEKTYEENNT